MPLSTDPKKRAKQVANLKMAKKGDKFNPKGRPKDSLNRIIEEIRKAGLNIERPSKTEIRDSLVACTFTTEQQLKAVVNDKQKPMFLRIVAREILGNNGYDTVEKILDRVIGKKLDITSDDKPVKTEPLIVEIIDKAEDVDKPTDEE